MNGLKLNREDNFFYLLAGLAILLVTGPVLSEWFDQGWTIAAELSFSLLLIVGVWSLQRSRQRFILGLVLMAIFLLGTAANLILQSEVFLWLTIPARLLFLALTAMAVLEQVMLRGSVTLNKIIGAVCVYLILGTFWALLCLTLEMAVPGSYSGLEHYDEELWFWRLIYYSFVTLTTVGYGDITPANAYSETLAWLEAIVGQFYIAILVASLVGMYIAGHANSEADADEELAQRNETGSQTPGDNL
jgi:peptidoglycan/LPS O-acetylase OafA/YrhL